ncbi:ferredoxin [Amycolatopsis anabasis]|uniref:ferredoxin n=1 Tax=Amycolatopsis anabasis TaxID=1840409 RepID=UPI00131D80D6|nr:ferredoxin [Amycolatopsis anabasis]
MALKITVDLENCKGYACCMMESPNLFDIDDASGKAILLQEHPADEQRDEAERAVRSCPANVIVLENG